VTALVLLYIVSGLLMPLDVSSHMA